MEGPGDRYTLSGLISLYLFEPKLRDIYVEGRIDASLVTWFLRQSGLNLPKVFAVDDRVIVPAHCVAELGLDINVRGRAIALAAQCEGHLGADQEAVTVVVDADFMHLAGQQPGYACLLATDQPAMEGYLLLGDAPLEKFLRLSLHQPEEVTVTSVRDAILPALDDILAVRYVLHTYSIPCIDDVASVCTLIPGNSGADMQELVRRSLTRYSKQDWPMSLEGLMGDVAVARQAVESTGQHGRGHDIARLLISFLGLKGISANQEALEMAMRSSLERADLDTTPLFRAIAQRVSGRGSDLMSG